jgi:excisionase family DNA binding protein/PAS domain S-box-containing protein
MAPSVDRMNPGEPADGPREHHLVPVFPGATPRLRAAAAGGAPRPQVRERTGTEAGLALVSTDVLTRGRLVDVSPALAALLGATVASLHGRALDDVLRRDDPDDDGSLAEVLAGRRPSTGGVRRLVRADGRLVECQITASVAHAAADGQSTVLFSATPLSAALVRARGRHRAAAGAVAASPHGVAVFDVHGRCAVANRAWTALGGVGADAGDGHALLDAVDDPGAVRAAVSAATRGVGRTLTVRATRPDGTPVAVRVLLVPRTDEGGVAAGFFAFGHEVESGEVARDGDADERPGPSAVPITDTVGAGVVAQTLGVSISTVRRWIEEGRLHATRTPGGHRRIPRAELRRMAGAMTNPGRVRTTELPGRGLPVLGALLEGAGRALVGDAARLTYDRAYPGWFAGPAAAGALDAWHTTAGRAIAAGRPGDAVHVTTALFRTARDVVGLEECLVFAERLSMLLLRRLEQEPGGRAELRDARTVLAAMRRALAILEDQRG